MELDDIIIAVTLGFKSFNEVRDYNKIIISIIIMLSIHFIYNIVKD